MRYIFVYIVITLATIILGFLCKIKFKLGDYKIIDGRSVYLVMIFIIFTILMGLRASTVGVDTAPYSRIYTSIGNSDSLMNAMKNSTVSAPIYVLICRVLFMISKNPQILTFVSACFVNIGILVFIKRTSDNFVLSTFLWIGLLLFYFSMNGNRQCMALVLTINALIYLEENITNKNGWILLFLAVGIHSTSLIAIVAILGIIIAQKVKAYKLIFIGSFIGSLIGAVVLKGAVAMFVKIFPKYSMYLGTSKVSIFNNTSSGRIMFLYLFLLVINFLWAIKNRNEQINQNDKVGKLLPVLILCAVLGIIFSKDILINRLLLYFVALFVSFIPTVLKSYTKSFKLLLYLGVFMILFSYSVLSLVENQNGIVPYQWFWD